MAVILRYFTKIGITTATTSQWSEVTPILSATKI